MKKMDSIENVALTGALLKTKNLEDLNKLKLLKTPSAETPAIPSVVIDKMADYPGGINDFGKKLPTFLSRGCIF
jgi:hypothetical protein